MFGIKTRSDLLRENRRLNTYVDRLERQAQPLRNDLQDARRDLRELQGQLEYPAIALVSGDVRASIIDACQAVGYGSTSGAISCLAIAITRLCDLSRSED